MSEEPQPQGEGEPTSGSDAQDKKKRQNYFKAELHRLRKANKEERRKPIYDPPEKKEFFPFVYNQLGSYLDTSEATFIIEKGHDQIPETPSRETSIRLCEPWVDLAIDSPRKDPAKSDKKSPRRPPAKSQGKEDKDDPHKDMRNKGSTHLPPWPRVNIDYNDYVNRELSFADVGQLRKEANEKYLAKADGKIQREYTRTKEDFYRMRLDQLDQVGKLNRDNLCRTYQAYLRNTVGATKAIRECLGDLKKKESKEKESKEAAKASEPQAAPSEEQEVQPEEAAGAEASAAQ